MISDAEQVNLIFARRLAIFCLAVHLVFSMVGWNNTLLAHHANRQCHTAITAYYFVKDGLKLHYETPYMGAPWVVPVEFPLFQGITASIVRATGWPLDQTGRGVSLSFFYLMLLVLYRFVLALGADKSTAWLSVAFCLSSPIYLFWSRTFLQEVMVLLFCILYLWAVTKSLQKWQMCWVILALLAGVIAAVTKITTFSLAMFVAGFLCLFWLLKQGQDKTSQPVLMKAGSMLVLYSLIPGIAGIRWTAFADSLKSLNLMTGGLTSKGMRAWDFGTLHQRLFGYFHHVPIHTLFFLLLGIFLFCLALAKGVRTYFALFFAAFVLAPIIFTNLFVAHVYYWCENTIYLCLAMAFLCSAMLARGSWALWLRRVVIPSFVIIMSGIALWRYLPGQVNDAGTYFAASARSVQRYVPQDGVILIYGFAIDPTFAYYTQRKAIMVEDSDIDSQALSRTIDLIGKKNIKGVIVGPLTSRDEGYFKDVARSFGLDQEVSLTDGQGRITQYDIETYGYDWNGVSSKLISHGWAFKVNPVELRLAPGYDADQGRLAQVLGADYLNIENILKRSHDTKCFYE